MESLARKLDSYIYAVSDFPQPGILFRDITPLLADAKMFGLAAETLAGFAPAKTDAVAAVEARGFIFGAAAARILNLPFIPVRKPGKLPRKTVSARYLLEYGEDVLHAHADCAAPGARIFLVDDLIATGGTLCAAAEIMESLGAAVVQTACLIELAALGGRKNYNRPLRAVLRY
ncbi:MAG: adenine phosphoribosyltransferase [Betaproteobacteria bacterium]|nr:adenine phosphoribosyltransferase [Betaproteobacteria bacterium]